MHVAGKKCKIMQKIDKTVANICKYGFFFVSLHQIAKNGKNYEKDSNIDARRDNAGCM